MKHPLATGFCLLLLAGNALLAQDPPPGPSASRGTAPEKSELAKFDLSFPGGTPRDLLTSIQNAGGPRVNAIIPEEIATVQLPALKIKHVDVLQLFQALSDSSRAAQLSGSGTPKVVSSYGFRPAGSPVTDDTIWNFYAAMSSKSSAESKACRFYSLAPYLVPSKAAKALTVDDIMTAIETGWKMLGETNTPNVKFHKDTGLLIAVGEPRQLMIIDSALRALDAQVAAGGGEGRTEKTKNTGN